ncbi:retrotransposon protein, putative, ty1-copia subclass [Tanacetum coccineum]
MLHGCGILASLAGGMEMCGEVAMERKGREDPVFAEAALTRTPKGVPDSSFCCKIAEFGINKFKSDLENALPGSTLYTTSCIEEQMVQKNRVSDLIPGVKYLRCMHKKQMNETECMSLALGRLNAHNLIFATQIHAAAFTRIPRTPVMSYDMEDQLGVLAPSTAQRMEGRRYFCFKLLDGC